jgi:predicted CoA-binding protein
MKRTIEEFVNCKRLAVVGVSRDEKKFGSMAYLELKERGYDLVPVHPDLPSFAGETCYPRLQAIPQPVDGAVVIVSPARVSDVLRDAAAAGVTRVWIQQGAESPEALALADELGLSVAHNACILMYAQPVRGFHKFHRAIVKLFGKL